MLAMLLRGLGTAQGVLVLRAERSLRATWLYKVPPRVLQRWLPEGLPHSLHADAKQVAEPEAEKGTGREAEGGAARERYEAVD